MSGKHRLKLGFTVLGWKQFLSAKKKMLDAFDQPREKAKKHIVEIYHGNVAEAVFRGWLSDFSPKRYAVTAGYIIYREMDDRSNAPR